MTAWKRKRILWSGLCVVTVAVFYGGLAGQWVRDDISLIQTNSYISDPSLAGKALRSSFWTLSGVEEDWNPVYSSVYRPVVTAAYIVQGRLFGMKPFGFHVVSLLLHLLCVVLAWQWLQERLPGPSDWAKDVAVTLGAAIFALHPSRGEVVAWVSGSTDLWMSAFALLGLLVWNRRDERRCTAPLAGLLFGLAFLSKEAAIVVPVLLATDAWCFGKRPFPGKKIAIVAAVFGAVVAARHLVVPLTVIEAPPEIFTATLRRALSSLGHYVHIVFTEWTPSVQVALRQALPGGEPYYPPWSIWVGAASLATALTGGLAALRVPEVRPWVADLLWFFVPLVPVLNIVDLQAYAMVSERFVYLPLLGVCAMVARATVPIFARPSLVRAVVAGIGVALLIAYGAITAVHATHFENEERLWTYELSVNPDNHAAVKALESIAWGRGQWKEALAFNVQGYQIALKARESRLAMEFVLQASRRVMLRTPDRDQATLGRLKAAYDDYLETNHFILETAPFRADMKTSAAATRDMSARLDLFRLPRCIVWARTGNLDGAIRQMRAILSEHPSSVEGWSLLTRWLAQQGKWPEAVAAVDDMKRHLPDHPASAEVEATLRRAQVLANQRVSTAVERVIRDARVQAILGARQNARQLLDPWVEENPDHFELVVARAQLDTAERSFEAPRRLLERGRDAAASDEKELWERALSELQALENSSDSSRRSDRATRPRGAEEGPKQR